MWGGGKMITVTRIFIRQQYSLFTEVMETPAFKTKTKMDTWPKIFEWEQSFLPGTWARRHRNFFISNLILRKYFIKLHLKIFLLKELL